MSYQNLSSILSASPDRSDSADAPGIAREIPIAQIIMNRYQPRRDFDEERLQELAASIREHGILQPVLVRECAPDRYELVAGERRFRAAKMAGLTTIPAQVRVMTDREQCEISLIENLQREDLSPVETALAFRRMMQEFKLTQQQVAERVGKDQSTISRLLYLLKLPDRILHGLERGEIKEGHAQALLQVTDEALQEWTYEQIIADRLSVQETEQLIGPGPRSRTKPAPSSAPSPTPPPAENVPLEPQRRLPTVPLSEAALQEQLAEKLATRIVIERPTLRGGYIQINFRDDENLLHILNTMIYATA